MSVYELGQYQEVRVDGLGDAMVAGPSNEEAERIREMIQRWGRSVGQIAAETEQGLDVMLGLLDGGFGVDNTMDALVMHEDLPDSLEVGDGKGRVQVTEPQKCGDNWQIEIKH